MESIQSSTSSHHHRYQERRQHHQSHHQEQQENHLLHRNGYFRSAVAVQHKRCQLGRIPNAGRIKFVELLERSPEIGQALDDFNLSGAVKGSCSDASFVKARDVKDNDFQTLSNDEEFPSYRKVVWPSPSPDPPRLNVQPQHLQHQYDQQLGEEEHDVDRPHQWMKHVTDQMLQSSHVAKEYEMELQKNTWNAHMSNRVSRSRTKSKDIMERARSFERCAAELRSSAPTSRRGSFSSRYRAPRSPSVGNARTDQYWYQVLEGDSSRPPSRQDYETRRWPSVGRVDVSSWEDRIRSEPRTKYKLQTPPSSAPVQRPGEQHFQDEMQKFALDIAERVVDNRGQQRSLQTSQKSQRLKQQELHDSSHVESSSSGLFHAKPAKVINDDEKQNEKNWLDLAEKRREEQWRLTAEKQEKVKQMRQESNYQMQSSVKQEQQEQYKSLKQERQKQQAKIQMLEAQRQAYECEQMRVLEEQRRSMQNMQRDQEERRILEEQRKRFEEERRQYQLRKEEREEQEEFMKNGPKTIKLKKSPSFHCQTELEESNHRREQFSRVRTGQVKEKHHFWNRSKSSDQLNTQHLGPSKRKRWLGQQDWIRQQALHNAQDDTLRPSSSLGQPFTTSGESAVKKTINQWGQIVKSQSTGAVLQDDFGQRPVSRSGIKQAWRPETGHDVDHEVNLPEVHTNQVHDTVVQWPQKTNSASVNRGNVTPSRQIANRHAANKTSRVTPEHHMEPSVNLVNVAIEHQNNHSDSKIHISNTAKQQMASILNGSSDNLNTKIKTSSSTSSLKQTSASYSSHVDQTSMSHTKSLPLDNKAPPTDHCNKTGLQNTHRSSSKQQQENVPHFPGTFGPKPFQGASKSSIETCQEQKESQFSNNVARQNSAYQSYFADQESHKKVIGPNPSKIPFPRGKGVQTDRPSFQKSFSQARQESKVKKVDVDVTTKTSSCQTERQTYLESGASLKPPTAPVSTATSNQTFSNIDVSLKPQATAVSTPSTNANPEFSFMTNRSNNSSTLPTPTTNANEEFSFMTNGSGSSNNTLPTPVLESWFQKQRAPPPPSTASAGGSTRRTDQPPIPVLAGWFGEEEKQKKELESNSKKKKHVDFMEAVTVSSPTIELQAEEAPEEDFNVKKNIARFQRGAKAFERQDSEKSISSSQDVASDVRFLREAFLQKTTLGTADAVQQEQELREKELAEISKARANVVWDREQRSTASNSETMRAARVKELQEIANLRSHCTTIAGDVSKANLEQVKEQRAQELVDIANMRSQTNWDEVVAATSAMFNKEQQPQSSEQSLKEIEAFLQEQADGIREGYQPSQVPPPPPRDSSRDFMVEVYGNKEKDTLDKSAFGQ